MNIYIIIALYLLIIIIISLYIIKIINDNLDYFRRKYVILDNLISTLDRNTNNYINNLIMYILNKDWFEFERYTKWKFILKNNIYFTSNEKNNWFIYEAYGIQLSEKWNILLNTINYYDKVITNRWEIVHTQREYIFELSQVKIVNKDWSEINNK